MFYLKVTLPIKQFLSVT